MIETIPAINPGVYYLVRGVCAVGSTIGDIDVGFGREIVTRSSDSVLNAASLNRVECVAEINCSEEGARASPGVPAIKGLDQNMIFCDSEIDLIAARQSRLSSNRVLAVGMVQQSHHFVERGNVEFCERADQVQPLTHRSRWIEQL